MLPESEWAAVLERAAVVGVRRVLLPATGPGDLGAVLRCVASFPHRLVAAVGCHPHDARLLDDATKHRLEQAVGHEGVVAVGEIGLDYHYDLSPREDQRRALAWQLDLARAAGLPVVLHHREAWEDFLADLDACPGLPGVAHSFTQGAAGATEMIARGLCVGISGMVTFPGAENVREAARSMPTGQLLVETDSPYLAPVPYRGRPNEPAWVRHVAERVAAVRGVTVEQLETETDAAFARVFPRAPA